MADSIGAAGRRAAQSHVPLAGLLALFWLSGAAALVYQVLWLRQLGRLFGVTAYASATTLAVFFLGLSLGGWIMSRRAARLQNPLRFYAILEIGIAASALLYFGIFRAYAAVQEPLFGGESYSPAMALAIKFLLAIGILLLPSTLMGGTLPVMAQYVVRQREQLGTGATLLYALNTLGATTGALAAGFVLPRWLGFTGAYATAILFNLVIAVQAWAWSSGRPSPPLPTAPATGDVSEGGSSAMRVGIIRGLAALSGAATLALEVLWTRMAAQVLQNSVYTFSLILAAFLLSLAIGSAVAHRLVMRARDLTRTMGILLLVSGLLVALTPFLFNSMAGSLEFSSSRAGFWAYVLTAFAGLMAILGPAVVCMGAVFPFLMRLSERTMTSAGRTIGELASINTAAAIVGSLLAGFVLLGSVGLWTSIWLIAAVYLTAAAVMHGRSALGVLAAGSVIGVLSLPALVEFDLVRGEEQTARETLVEAWEGPDGTVAVMRHGEGDLRLRINSSYNLGTSASAPNERLQGQWPFLLHPNPSRVFFLGLGTGITASGAMSFPFDQAVICELNANVIRASRRHFSPWLRGLFDDPRVTVIPEDGRTWLASHSERYDLVIGDIFLSYKAGVGTLYTREHFAVVRERLRPGGIFVQWIPVFDTSVREFEILARTFLEVFPGAQLWRRSHSPVFPVYALVGSLQDEPVDVGSFRVQLDILREDPDLDPNTWFLNIPFAAFVTDLRAIEDRFANAPINTDDRTHLEYSAPMTERNSKGNNSVAVLAWEPLLRFCESLQQHPAHDPAASLAGADDHDLRQVPAGTAYYGYEVMRRIGRDDEAERYIREFRRLVAP